MSEETTLKGNIDRIFFYNKDSGYLVALLKQNEGKLATIAGHGSIRVGMDVVCDGQWTDNPKYGRQFTAKSIVEIRPSDVNAIATYLASAGIKGVGPSASKKIVDAFGEQTFNVLDNDINSIESVKGLSRKQKDGIKDGWREHSAMREILVFLMENGVSAAMARKINAAYGGMAMRIINDDPWRMAIDVSGFGFRKADEIALRMGHAKHSFGRIRACLHHTLHEAVKNEGHCGILEDTLVNKSAETMGIDVSFVTNGFSVVCDERSPIFVREAREAAHGTQAMVWASNMHMMEGLISSRLTDLLKSPTPWSSGSIDATHELNAIEQKDGIKFAPTQKTAITEMLKSNVFIVTGGPGCGKTFLLNSVLKIMRRHRVSFSLAAPTGKAAARMTESTGEPAQTVHRLLGLGRGNVAETTEIDCDLLVIDEFSMVDVFLFHTILKSMRKGTAILLVGDADQLPSVGAGSVLNDMIRSETIPLVKLNQVFRQAQGSKIIVNAHRVNNGEMPCHGERVDDFHFIKSDTPESVAEIIADIVSVRLPQRMGYDPFRDIQVLCPMIKGPCGTQAMNALIQSKVNGNPSRSIKRYGGAMVLGTGDRVLQTVNRYDKNVFNGDSGFIEEINADTDELEVFVRMAGGNLVKYENTEIDDLILSYAMTIHKSQGSDFPVVIVPMVTSHFMMLQRNLLYTGITRARKMCVLVGQPKAVAMSVKNDKVSSRNTRLMALLRTAAGITF